MKTRFIFLATLLALVFPFISHAQIPRTLSYQGVLTDNAGKPRPDGKAMSTLEKGGRVGAGVGEFAVTQSPQ